MSVEGMHAHNIILPINSTKVVLNLKPHMMNFYLFLVIVLSTTTPRGLSFYRALFRANPLSPDIIPNKFHLSVGGQTNIVDNEDFALLLSNIYFHHVQSLGSLRNIESDSYKIDKIEEDFTSLRCICNHPDRPGKAIHLKYAKNALTRSASPYRLQYEFKGMNAIGKYSPDSVPRVLFYDHERSLIVTELLTSYQTLYECLLKGVLDVDYSRAIGTIMGRSHARTCKWIVTPHQMTKYEKAFSNPDHSELWLSSIIQPTLQLLYNSSGPRRVFTIAAYRDELREQEEEEKFDELLQKIADENIISRAIEVLQDIYRSKKEAVIHGNLQAQNIWVSTEPNDDDKSNALKVINFEKTTYGAPGLDLGVFLANILWFHAAHWQPNVRRSLVSAAMSAVESYKSAFFVQSKGAGGGAAGNTALSVDAVLNDILVDALGFMGLYGFYLAVCAPEEEVLSVQQVDGMDWGDAIGRAAAVRRRQVRMSASALKQFLHFWKCNHLEDVGSAEMHSSTFISLDAFRSVFKEDDEAMFSEHETEFWS